MSAVPVCFKRNISFYCILSHERVLMCFAMYDFIHVQLSVLINLFLKPRAVFWLLISHLWLKPLHSVISQPRPRLHFLLCLWPEITALRGMSHTVQPWFNRVEEGGRGDRWGQEKWRSEEWMKEVEQGKWCGGVRYRIEEWSNEIKEWVGLRSRRGSRRYRRSEGWIVSLAFD